MGQFGDQLRSQREARGVSLEQISEETRISVPLLTAIEMEQFELLPGGVFNTSFVRQYARCVGLDEQRTVNEFHQVAQPIELNTNEFLKEGHDDQDTSKAGATLAENITEYARRYRKALPALLAALGVAVAMAVVMLSSDSGTPPLPQQPAVSGQRPDPGDHAGPGSGTAPVKHASPSEAIVTRSAAEPASPPAPLSQPNLSPSRPVSDKPLRVELSITDTVWIRALADGERVFEDVLRPGQTRSIEANDSVRLFVGNAGGVKVALNGQQLPPIGSPGQVQRVLVTSSGMKLLPPPLNRSDQADDGASESIETGNRPASDDGPPAVAGVKRTGR